MAVSSPRVTMARGLRDFDRGIRSSTPHFTGGAKKDRTGLRAHPSNNYDRKSFFFVSLVIR